MPPVHPPAAIVNNGAGLINLVVSNRPPAAQTLTLTRTAGLSAHFALADVATNWSDPDGDPVTLAGLNLTTTNGVQLQTNGGLVRYPNSPNVNDQISYGVSDGYGGTNIGYINIIVSDPAAGNQSITAVADGNPTAVTAYGVPGLDYILERATNLAPAVWVDIDTNTAAANGLINAVDTFDDLGGTPPDAAYYRLKWQP